MGQGVFPDLPILAFFVFLVFFFRFAVFLAFLCAFLLSFPRGFQGFCREENPRFSRGSSLVFWGQRNKDWRVSPVLPFLDFSVLPRKNLKLTNPEGRARHLNVSR